METQEHMCPTHHKIEFCDHWFTAPFLYVFYHAGQMITLNWRMCIRSTLADQKWSTDEEGRWAWRATRLRRGVTAPLLQARDSQWRPGAGRRWKHACSASAASGAGSLWRSVTPVNASHLRTYWRVVTSEVRGKKEETWRDATLLLWPKAATRSEISQPCETLAEQ